MMNGYSNMGAIVDAQNGHMLIARLILRLAPNSITKGKKS
jgi:hypothetical protein